MHQVAEQYLSVVAGLVSGSASAKKKKSISERSKENSAGTEKRWGASEATEMGRKSVASWVAKKAPKGGPRVKPRENAMPTRAIPLVLL